MFSNSVTVAMSVTDINARGSGNVCGSSSVRGCRNGYSNSITVTAAALPIFLLMSVVVTVLVV